MAEAPKALSADTAASDQEALIRISLTPTQPRQKRMTSTIAPFVSSGGSGTPLPFEAVPTPEDLLIQTLLAIENEEITFDVFQFVIEMLDDMSKHYLPGQSCKDIFSVIFSLLLKAVPPIQATVVANISQLLLSNPGIMHFTKDTEWLSGLLVFLPRFEDTAVLDELFKLVEILGSYHISVKQVKMMFKLFQIEDTAFKSYYWQNIFPLLQRLWHGRDGRPNDYFELDGYNSGLMLPALKLPGGGYSIATWVNVSSFSSNYMRETYQPYLFSFLTDDGVNGIEAHFNRGKMILRTNPNHSNVSKREVRVVNYDFQENRWYFIVVTHTKKLILSDECNVYVNGESVHHFTLKYPKADQALKASRIGTAGPMPEPRTCLRGKLAGFLAFDDTLNPDEVRALYNHGPNLFSSLRPLEQLVLLRPSRLTRRPSVLFFYSPRATDLSVCLEPWSNDASRHANMLPGVRTCITMGFQDSLSSVGGIQLLLPLFSSSYRPSSGEIVDVNTKVIALLIELVTDNDFALSEMLRSKFFQVMGYLLATDFTASTSAPGVSTTSSAAGSGSQQAPINPPGSPSVQSDPRNPPGSPSLVSQQSASVTDLSMVTDAASTAPNSSSSSSTATQAQKAKASNKWSPQAIDVLDKLAFAVSGYGATNASKTNGPLTEQMFKHVYLNFQIWNCADYEVQLALLKSLNNHVKRDPEQFHQYLSVSLLMTLLAEYFTFSAFAPTELQTRRESVKSSSMLRRSAIMHSAGQAQQHAAKMDWSKRPRPQLMELRKALLGTLHCFIQSGISVKETKAIFNYLHFETTNKPEDKRLIHDVLQVLLVCLGERHASLLSHINSLGNLAIFLPLLNADNEKFRVWTLKVVGKLIQNSEGEQKENILSHMASLRKALEPYPLSLHTYNVLLEILIDSVSADGLINPVDLALHPSTPAGGAQIALKNLNLLSVIFNLLNSRSDIELRIKVLKDFQFYLKKGPDNRAKFTGQRDWQAWLLSLLVPESPVSVSSASSSTTTVNQNPASLTPAPAPGTSASAARRPARPAKGAVAAASLPATSPAVSGAYNVLLGLVTDVFALIFEAAFLQPHGAAAIFQGTSAVLRRMGTIDGFDAVAIANSINTRVIKTMYENNLAVRCKASPVTFQVCVQYLLFVESTFFRTPSTSAQTYSLQGRELFSPLKDSSGSKDSSALTDSSASTTGSEGSPSLAASGQLPPPSSSVSLRNSGSVSSSPERGSALGSSSGSITSGEKESIKFGERALLPLLLYYSSNGTWVSFTLAQRVLELVDQLFLNKIERSANMELPAEVLDGLEGKLSRFRTRLVLYSIVEGSTFKSNHRLRMRKESIRNIKQVINDGFLPATTKASELSSGIQASLQRYLTKKTRQWETEMSDVDAMYHKNVKRIKALLETTPSTHAALYLVAYIGALVQKTGSASAIPTQISSSASNIMSPLTPAVRSSGTQTPPATPLLAQLGSSSSNLSLLSTPSKETMSSSGGLAKSSASIVDAIFSATPTTPAPATPVQAPPQASTPAAPASAQPSAVQLNDESVQLTQQLWRDAIQNIRQRLMADANYGPMFSRLEGEVLSNFFETGFNAPKDFVLAPAIEKAIDFIVNNDMNAMNATQTELKAIAERYIDMTQEGTMSELQAHKAYEQELIAFATASVSAAREASSLYRIRHSQYISAVASEWKNLLRGLLDTRGPWSSPYVGGVGSATGDSPKMYWKLDSTENSQRMRLRLKRHYGDMSIVENASARNDEKERLLLESLQNASGTGSLSSVISPSGSLVTLPPFEQATSGSDLLKLVAPRTGRTPGSPDEDESALIDTEIGSQDDEGDESSEEGRQSGQPGQRVLSPTSSSSNLAQSPSVTPPLTSNNKSVEERTLIVTTCEYVKGISSIAGDFELTTHHIYFRNLEQGVFKTIPLEKLKLIYSRRYMLRSTALEFFTVNHTSHFFHFDKMAPGRILKAIIDRHPSKLREYFAGSSAALARKKKHITEAWRKRQISNFEYLMELNTIAGRSYNDLSQYPVFPWIIADYESERIDLNNPAVYRDLSKPIGAINKDRLDKFLFRFEEMVKSHDPQDPNSSPPFLYGSHYSSHSIVLYYLIRLEPFTTQSLELQGGQFDLPARLFTSISETWKNCMTNQSDVKELIPEFFFLPSFLTDPNDINLGFLKSSSSSPININSVQLPPWAPTPQAFVQMNRMALESEYVSAHLHEWIDLIFGFKQTGQDAVDADNVFYYTSYEGNVDIDSISDPTLKQSVQMQIREFGQTPSQLFTTPHPTRLNLEDALKARRSTLTNFMANAISMTTSAEPEWKPTATDLSKNSVLSMRPGTVANAEIVSIHVDTKNERFILTFMDGLVQSVAYKIPRGKRFPLTLTPQWTEVDVISTQQKREEHSLENTAWAPGLNPSQSCFAFSSDSKILLNCGSWDRSFSLSMVGSSVTTYQIVSEHKDVVTCLALAQDHDNLKLISASRDCNVMVWDFDQFSTKKKADTTKELILPKPKLVLFGHDDAINAVAVNADLNMIVTASQDGTCIIYDLHKGHYNRTIIHDSPVTLVAINKYGDIVTYCAQGELLYLHSVNGVLLQRLSGVGKLSTLRFSSDGQLLVTSGQSIITVRSLFMYSLKRIYLWKCPAAVSAVELFSQDEYLLVGLTDGTLLTVIFDMNKLLTDMSRELALEKHD